MPRDDLSIDLVNHRMAPIAEVLDPALILEDWTTRVSNLPEEIRFLQDEIAEKDRLYDECIRIIEDRDARIHRFIKASGSHEPNPREEAHRQIILEHFQKAEVLADEKIALAAKMQAIVDRHTRYLDMQIKQLYDRREPGFTDPDELPSLLRPSAANKPSTALVRTPQPAPIALVVSDLVGNPAKTIRVPGVSSVSSVSGATVSSVPIPILPTIAPARGLATPQGRHVQAQQASHASSAPVSPSSSMNHQARESSSGPGSGIAGKRNGRSSSNLRITPPVVPGLARHSSVSILPKTNQAAGSGRPAVTGLRHPVRSKSPSHTSTVPDKPPHRKKNAPNASTAIKTVPSRVKRHRKASVSSAEGDLSGSSSDEESDESGAESPPRLPSMPGRGGHGGHGSHGSHGSAPGGSHGNGHGNGHGHGHGHGHGYSYGTGGHRNGSSHPAIKREKDDRGGLGGSGASGHTRPGLPGNKYGFSIIHVKTGYSSDDRMDMDDEEGGDDSKYCLCQNVSFGDMVACDNPDCPYEWFHWSCVDLKSEPTGKWFCPVCTEKKRGGSGSVAARGGAGNTGSGSASGTPGYGSGTGSRAGSAAPAAAKKGK